MERTTEKDSDYSKNFLDKNVCYRDCFKNINKEDQFVPLAVKNGFAAN